MSYIPVQVTGGAPTVNPVSGKEKDGDIKIEVVSGSKVIFMWIGEWKQIFPAVFA
jgi:hypothetical protein